MSETEKRLGFLAVMRSIEGKKFVLPSVPEEDYGKRERVLPEEIWTAVVPGMLGGLSESVKTEDQFSELDLFASALRTLKRGAEKERGLHFEDGQLERNLRRLDGVEQIRRGVFTPFNLWYSNLFLNLSPIEKMQREGAIVLPTFQMLNYLHEHKNNIRPSTIAAIMETIKWEQGF